MKTSRETFEGENFHGSVGSEHFMEKTCGMLNQSHRWVRHTENVLEKPFASGSHTAKFVKVFSLESFPLKGKERRAKLHIDT